MTEKKKPRIPSMAWTAIAFVPWILYWVLAGVGHTTAAVLSGLAVSLALNGYRFAIRKVKILEVVSLAFLAVSAFVTLVLRSDLLVFYGGVLSNVTLALMAWGSLIAGNPFTYDYAKEDWDEAFWSDPIFVKTNQIITAVWGGIFTIQALMEGMAMVMGLEGAVQIILGGRSPFLAGGWDRFLRVVPPLVSPACGGATGRPAHRRDTGRHNRPAAGRVYAARLQRRGGQRPAGHGAVPPERRRRRRRLPGDRFGPLHLPPRRGGSAHTHNREPG